MDSSAVPTRSRVLSYLTVAALAALMLFMVLRTEAHGQVAPIPPPPPPPDSVAPEIVVTKDASVTSIVEPIATVTFTVTIENVGPVSAAITSIEDDQFGNLLDPANPAVENNTCVDLAGVDIPVDGTETCSFDGAVRGQCVSTHTNEVTVTVHSDRQFPDAGSDTADVEITCPDRTPTPTVTSTPTATATPDSTPPGDDDPDSPTDGDDPTPGSDDPELTATADPPTPATTGMGVTENGDGFATEASLLAAMMLVVVTGSLVVRTQRRRS